MNKKEEHMFEVEYFFKESGDGGRAFFVSEKNAEKFANVLRTKAGAIAVVHDCREEKQNA